MADIGATNVTYTINNRTKMKGHPSNKWLVYATVAFGNAVLTYPAGGVPLTTAKLQVSTLDSVEFIESNGSALKYEWDRSANTIRIFNPTQESNSTANRAGAEYVAATTAPAATSLEVEVWGE